MQNSQNRRVQAFVRVDAWFAAHPEMFPAGESTTTALEGLRTNLAGVAARITANAAAQTTAQQQTTLASRNELTLRAQLRDVELKAIAGMAQALKATVPGIGTIKLPGSAAQPTVMLDHARSVRAVAAVYEQVLIEHGLPADFLARLDRSIDALQQSVNARSAATTRVVDATKSVEADIKLGNRLVAMMDASLKHRLAPDSVALATWRQAKRVTTKPVTRSLGLVTGELGSLPNGAVGGAGTAGSSGSSSAVPAVNHAA